MEALVSIRGDFNRFVRRDSQAFIRKPLGIGDAMIEITRGKGDPLPDNAQTIQSVSDKAPTQMLEETLADFRTQIVPALSELRAAVSEYTRLAADLRGQQPGIKAAVGNFNRITEDVEAGKGVVGMLLADPNAADSVRQTIPKLADSMENVRSTTADLRKLVSTLPQLKQSAQQTLDEAPGLVLEIEETSRQLQLLVKALQRNWLIRGGIEPSPEDTKISAERVGTDR
jgi:ABC-type transporter Mla subunit MlaD